MVKDAVRETEGRLMTLVKEQNLAKLSVAPERIDGL